VLTPQVANPHKQLFFIVLQVYACAMVESGSLTTQMPNKSAMGAF